MKMSRRLSSFDDLYTVWGNLVPMGEGARGGNATQCIEVRSGDDAASYTHEAHRRWFGLHALLAIVLANRVVI